MPFYFSQRSLKNREGVHPDLVALSDKALLLSTIDFGISEGLRSIKRQKILYDSGATWTLNSRHLDGHAIDVFAWIDGEVRWDWPCYYEIYEAFRRASIALAIEFEWGGHWKGRQKDGPHFQLPWLTYPSRIIRNDVTKNPTYSSHIQPLSNRGRRGNHSMGPRPSSDDVQSGGFNGYRRQLVGPGCCLNSSNLHRDSVGHWFDSPPRLKL